MKANILSLCFLAGLLLAGCETKFRVEGDSMLPTLLGGSLLETCPECGYTSPGRSEGAFVCANCRWLVREEERGNLSQKKRFYDEVVVQNGLKPKRDDLVLVATEEGTLAVKRVLGEPGEELAIHQGKVWVNGKRPIRSLEKWEENRILVHDDRFRPHGISRWQPWGKWNCFSDSWQVQMDKASTPFLLAYHHAEGSFWEEKRKIPNPSEEKFVPATITNLRSENGPQMRDEWIHAVDELMLTCRLSTQVKEGTVMVQLPLGETVHTFWLVSHPAVLDHWPKEWFQSGSWSVYQENLPSQKSDEWVFSTLDGTPRVWRNRLLQSECTQEYLQAHLPKTVGIKAKQERPKQFPYRSSTEEEPHVRIGFQGIGRVKWEQITLFRGEYWFFYSPYFNKMPKLDGETLAIDGKKGYYLIGDNCLVSRDSRLWGVIPSEKIRGVVRKSTSSPIFDWRRNFP